MKRTWVQSADLACALLLITSLGSAFAQDQGKDSAGESWGGEHVAMQMTAQGATMEFDCAHGTIVQPVKPDAKGAFTLTGTYTQEHGGPVFKSNPPRDVPAVYKGTMHGEHMTLEIVLNGGDQRLPQLSLTRGATGHLTKCR